jgi:hypothetical protein
MGLGSGWVLAIAFGAMMLCHLMHFGMHKHEKEGENDYEHRPLISATDPLPEMAGRRGFPCCI